MSAIKNLFGKNPETGKSKIGSILGKIAAPAIGSAASLIPGIGPVASNAIRNIAGKIQQAKAAGVPKPAQTAVHAEVREALDQLPSGSEVVAAAASSVYEGLDKDGQQAVNRALLALARGKDDAAEKARQAVYAAKGKVIGWIAIYPLYAAGALAGTALLVFTFFRLKNKNRRRR